MQPVSFHPQEESYTLPGDDSVLPLPVLRVMFGNSPCLVSCWKPSLSDLFRLLLGKPVYLIIFSQFQPPVSITTEDLGLHGN